jgi:hypothetical protein
MEGTLLKDDQTEHQSIQEAHDSTGTLAVAGNRAQSALTIVAAQ